jgi:excisionase family DNA binding protein
VSISDSDQLERARAARLARRREQVRLRAEAARSRRQEAVKSGKALYVSINEASELIGVHPATLKRRIDDGTFKAKKLKGRWLIYRDQLDTE